MVHTPLCLLLVDFLFKCIAVNNYKKLKPFHHITYSGNCQWMSCFSINPSYIPVLYLQMVLCSASQSITNQKIIKQKKQPTFFDGKTKGKHFLCEAKENNICTNILLISLLKLNIREGFKGEFYLWILLSILSQLVCNTVETSLLFKSMKVGQQLCEISKSSRCLQSMEIYS